MNNDTECTTYYCIKRAKDFKNMNKTLILTVLALIGLGANAVEYGQDCDNDNAAKKCHANDILDPLQCKGSICQCEDDMYRHPSLGRCVAPDGAPCTLKAGDGKHFRTCTNFAQCWPNNPPQTPSIMITRENGTCRCDPDAKLDATSGLCKLKHGSTRCEQATDCDTASLLTCDEGKCVCMQEGQVYDGTSCKALVGGQCGENNPFPKIECGANMKCGDTTKICECDAGFTATPDKTCGKPFNGTCSDTSECHPQFVCGGDPKRCICPDKQEYNADTNQCVILVGETCSTNSTENPLKCVAHSTCKDSKCTCDENYMPGTGDKEGKCIGLYGSSCADTTCNGDDFLACGDQSKICECLQGYDKDDQKKKCVGKIEMDCKDTENCIGNSVCNSGKCGCGTDQEASADKTKCHQKFGGVCQSNDECVPGKFLGCLEGTCQCEKPEEMVSEDNDKCVGLAEKPCGPGLDCVNSATCATNVCKCVTGFIPNEGKCVEGNGKDSPFSSSMGMMGMIAVMLFGKLF